MVKPSIPGVYPNPQRAVTSLYHSQPRTLPVQLSSFSSHSVFINFFFFFRIVRIQFDFMYGFLYYYYFWLTVWARYFGIQLELILSFSPKLATNLHNAAHSYSLLSKTTVYKKGEPEQKCHERIVRVCAGLACS